MNLQNHSTRNQCENQIIKEPRISFALAENIYLTKVILKYMCVDILQASAVLAEIMRI